MRYAQSKIFKVKLTKKNERPNITKKILLAMITQFQLPERLFVQPVSCQCAKSLYSLFCVISRKKSFSQRHNFFIYLSLKKKTRKVCKIFFKLQNFLHYFIFGRHFFCRQPIFSYFFPQTCYSQIFLERTHSLAFLTYI